MKNRLSKLNIVSICFLGMLLMISSLDCIKISHQALPANDLIDERVEYQNMLSVFLVMMVLSQAALWFFNRKLFRGIGIALSIAASMMCVGRIVAIYASESLIGGPTISLTPLGFSAVIISIAIVILTVVSLLRMNRVTMKT